MRKYSVSIIVLFICIAFVQAQIGDCPILVQEALEIIGDTCNPMERNSACYGSHTVESTTFDVRPDDFFFISGDQAELSLFQEIHPRPLDEDLGSLGIVVLNVQANLPDTLPG